MPEPQDMTAEEHDDQIPVAGDDFEAAFDAAVKLETAAEEPGKAQEPVKPEADAGAFVAEKLKEIEKKAEPEGAEKPKAEEKPKTIKEIAEARAAELSGEAPPPPAAAKAEPAPTQAPPKPAAEEKAKEPEKTKDPEVQALSLASNTITKDDVNYFVSQFGLDSLPEGDIVVPGGTVNLRQFVEEYPLEATAIRVLAGKLAEQTVLSAVDSGFLVKKADVDTAIAKAMEKYTGVPDKVVALENQLRQERTFTSLEVPMDGAKPIPDARQVLLSPDFRDWCGGLSPAMQKIVQSTDIRDIRLAIDFYKESKGIAAVADHDKKAREKKAKADDLLGGAMRSGTGAAPRGGGGAKVDEDDFDGAFLAEAAKQAARLAGK